VRAALIGAGALVDIPGWVSVNGNDEMIFDIQPNPNGGTGISSAGFGHPPCINDPTSWNDGGSTMHL